MLGLTIDESICNSPAPLRWPARKILRYRRFGGVLFVLSVISLAQVVLLPNIAESFFRSAIRTLSDALEDGVCRWLAPQPISPLSPIYSTLLVGYPGSGKRLAYSLIEGMTGG